MYIGQSLKGGAVSATALKHFEDNIRHANSSQGTLGVQMCGFEYNFNHIFFGLIATTSDGSPLVGDCREMVRMLEDRELPTRWPPVGALEKQREFARTSCARFVVTGKSIHGNVDFKVGAQDVIGLVADSTAKSGGDGRVGSKGTMNCKG